MLSLQLFSHPIIKTNTTPSSLYRQNTHSSLAHFTAKSRTNGSNIFDNISPISSPFRFRLAAAAASNDDSAMSFGFSDYNVVQLPEGLEPELMPKHISVVMDGNRRWAAERNLPVEFAHREEGKKMKQLVMSCMKLGIKVVSLFAMSTENYRNRYKEEIESLVKNSAAIAIEMHDLIRYGLKVNVIGDKFTLPHSIESLVSAAEGVTKANKGLHLVMAANYGGKYDIVQASKKVATKVRDGVLDVEDVNEALFEQHLLTNCIEFPNPDLIIRTSGEFRISNFMLWQSAYSELLFVKKLFPDFEEADLIEALREFQQRKRRYGG